jgi:hypothetical protein
VVQIDELPVITQTNYGLLYETPKGALYRLRFLNVNGRLVGTVGTSFLSLVCLTTVLAPNPWSAAQPIVAGSGASIPLGDFDITWSTEVGTNYAGYSSNEGVIRQVGIPLVWMYAQTTISLGLASQDGSDANTAFTFGHMQLEVVPYGGAGGGGASEYELYLQPRSA